MKIATAIATGALALLLALPAQAADLPSFEFRGNRIGDPIEKNFPYRNDDPRRRFDDGLPACWPQNNPRELKCNDPTATAPEERPIFGRRPMLVPRTVVGGIEVSKLHYEFIDARLVGVEMVFRFDDVETIKNMLVGKYGKPTSERIGLLGFIETRWAFKEGNLLLTMPISPRYAASLVFENPKATRPKTTADQAKGKKAF